MGQRHGDFGISTEEFHGHVDVLQAVFVGEINRSLGMEKVVGVEIALRPRVHGPQVAERLPVLQQYLHFPFFKLLT